MWKNTNNYEIINECQSSLLFLTTLPIRLLLVWDPWWAKGADLGLSSSACFRNLNGLWAGEKCISHHSVSNCFPHAFVFLVVESSRLRYDVSAIWQRFFWHHPPWKSSEGTCMWYLGTWFSGKHDGAGLMVGLSDLRVFPAPMTLWSYEATWSHMAHV